MKTLLSLLLVSLSSQAYIGGQAREPDTFLSNFSFRGTPNPCSGVFIGNRTFLTAAHCVLSFQGKPLFKKGQKVDFKHNENQSTHRFSLFRGTVESVFAHATYVEALKTGLNIEEASKLDDTYDVAYIKVKEEPPLPASRLQEKNELSIGTEIIVTGSGCEVFGGDRAQFLKSDKKSVIGVDDVIGRFSAGNVIPRSGYCKGDSGGPVFLKDLQTVVGLARRLDVKIDSDGLSDTIYFTVVTTQTLENMVRQEVSP